MVHYQRYLIDFNQALCIPSKRMIGYRPFCAGIFLYPRMESLARFVRTHVFSSGPIATSKSSRPEPTQAADCVYILGPGHDPTMASELHRRASREGLRVTVIGDGRTEVNREMVHEARAKGVIGPGTEVIALLHGSTRRVGGSEAKRHVLHTGFEPLGLGVGNKERKKGTTTTEFIHWLRAPLPDDSKATAQPEPWRGNIHLASCHVRSLAKEFMPETMDAESGKTIKNSLWEQGNVLLYGSSKRIMTEVALQNFDSVLRHLGECKRTGQKADVTETFRRVMLGSADSVSLLGGSLDEPLVSHAPKILLEATPGYLQARWAQMMAHEKLKNPATTNSSAVTEPVKHKLEKKPKVEGASISRENIARFFFTRVTHLKTSEKLAIMTEDLNRYPWLANVRNTRGATPLMYIAELSFARKDASVDAYAIAKVLIDKGADVNAQDVNGTTALSRAVNEEDAVMISLLLKAGARIDLLDKQGRTDLHSACMVKNHNPAIVTALLSAASADSIDRRDRNGRTALHMAITNGNVALVKTLLDAGADPEKRTGSWESPKSLARGARISDQATNQIIELLETAKAAKKMPRQGGA
jgi:hypothetical protein